MNCSECRYNMKERAVDSHTLRGKVACKYRTIRVHGFTFNTIIYVDPTDRCPYARKPPKPIVVRRRHTDAH